MNPIFIKAKFYKYLNITFYSKMKRRLKRIYSGSRLGLMILYSKITGKRIPLATTIHITNRCNLRCTYCYDNIDNRFEKPPKDYTTEELKDLIDQLYRLGTRWISLLGGEPLIRKDIGEIVKYIKKKGILCELATNATLLKHKMEEIKDVDSICISIDGDEESNDKVRGKGTYKKIVESLKIVKDYNIPVRLHAVLSKSNQNSLEGLSKLAKENNVTFGFSQAIVHDYNKDKEFDLSDEEKRKFWKKLKKMKEEGHPIYNSDFVLNKIINWPMEYDKVIKNKSGWPKKLRYKYFPCVMGKRYCYIDSEGVVYLCIVNGIKNGLNYKEVGLKKAWDYLGKFECETCSYIQYIETNNFLNLSFDAIFGGLRYLKK